MRFKVEHIFPDGVTQFRDTVSGKEIRVMTAKFHGRGCVAVTLCADPNEYDAYKQFDDKWYWMSAGHHEPVNDRETISFLEAAKNAWMHTLIMEP